MRIQDFKRKSVALLLTMLILVSTGVTAFAQDNMPWEPESLDIAAFDANLTLEEVRATVAFLQRTITATSADRVPLGIYWVTPAFMDSFNSAVAPFMPPVPQAALMTMAFDEPFEEPEYFAPDSGVGPQALTQEDTIEASDLEAEAFAVLATWFANPEAMIAEASDDIVVIMLSAAVNHFKSTRQTGTLPASESFIRNVALFPELWCSETLRTAPAFQWTGNNTHDLVGTTWNERPDRDNDFNIVEEVFIELPIDTDGDGRRDLIRATVRRPIESERYTDLRIPAFLETSPYREGTLGLTVIDVTTPMFATPDTSHYTYADVTSLLPRAADWPWDRAEAIHWNRDTQQWNVGVQPATRDIGVIPAARPAVASENVVTRGNPVPVTAAAGGGHVNHGGNFASYMFVRGYAVVTTNTVGNVFADGFTSTGGICETLSAVAAIKWLNGEARAFTCQDAIYEVDATSWSNGMVAMSGASYNGTLPIAAAATGVEGLGLIIPQVAISNWYYYHRGSGTVIYPGRNNNWHAGFPGEEASDLALICFTRRRTDGAALNAIAREIPSFMRFHAPANDPIFGNEGVQLRANADAHWADMIAAEDIYSGNYNRFWDERNYLATADRITAGIIMQHALGDFNVMPRHFDTLLRAVAAHSDAEMRTVLFRGGHGGFHTHGAVFDWQHLWFDHFLNGVANNALDMPTIQIQSSITGQYEAFDTWPIPGSVYRRYFLNPPADIDESAAGSLSFGVPAAHEFTIQDAWDNSRLSWNSTGIPPVGAQYVNAAFIDRTHGAGAQTGGRPQLLFDWESALFNVNDLDTPSSERLVFVTEITENVRVSGTIVASIEAASDVPWGNITASLVEIRPQDRGRIFTTTSAISAIPAQNGAPGFNIVNPTAPTTPSGTNFWHEYKKITMGHADIQNPNQDADEIIRVADFHAVAPGFENITRGRTYMEALETSMIPAYYYRSIVPAAGEFHTYILSFEVMDWEFRAGDLMAIMVYTSDYRYTMTPSNPPAVTIRTGANTFIDIPSITPFNVTEAVPQPFDLSFNIFNNGNNNNAGLANLGVIRMWPQINGAGANLSYAHLEVTAEDQDGADAMDFVRINRIWNNQGYVNMIDVNKHAPWQYIDLTVDYRGQTFEVQLTNNMFLSLRAFNNGTCDEVPGLAGSIRIWPQLGGVSAPIPMSAVLTAVDQSGNDAMHLITRNRQWVDGAGWQDNYMNFDVDKSTPWQTIRFTMTVFGQTVEVLLENNLFVAIPLDVLGLQAFNNGNSSNASLASAGIIRIWTQLNGANALVPFEGLVVTALNQDGIDASGYVRVNRVWNNMGYINLIDVTKRDANWETIDLTVTLATGQYAELLLRNDMFS
ncbi:MAG: hypothetical protein FWC75_01230 [Oscillospiraceae bacterium]|nr:hypothetical protein [Oscillospiraceae bacterium]